MKTDVRRIIAGRWCSMAPTETGSYIECLCSDVAASLTVQNNNVSNSSIIYGGACVGSADERASEEQAKYPKRCFVWGGTLNDPPIAASISASIFGTILI